MLHSDLIAVYCEIHTKCGNVLYGEKVRRNFEYYPRWYVASKHWAKAAICHEGAHRKYSKSVIIWQSLIE
jgi:hypothetical protein